MKKQTDVVVGRTKSTLYLYNLEDKNLYEMQKECGLSKYVKIIGGFLVFFALFALVNLQIDAAKPAFYTVPAVFVITVLNMFLCEQNCQINVDFSTLEGRSYNTDFYSIVIDELTEIKKQQWAIRMMIALSAFSLLLFFVIRKSVCLNICAFTSGCTLAFSSKYHIKQREAAIKELLHNGTIDKGKGI